MNKETQIKTLTAAVIAHVFWGFSFIASRYALDITHVFVLLSHRFLLAFAAMSAVIPFLKEKPRLNRKRALLLVALGLAEPVIYFFGEQYGILHSGTVFSGVMIAMIPIVATLAAAPILGEKPTPGQLLFSLLSVGGVIGIGLLGNKSGMVELIGVIALCVAVLAATVYTLLSRGISKEFSAFERTYMMLMTGAVVFTALALIVTKGDMAQYLRPLSDGRYLLAIGFLGICCSVMSYFLSAYAITKMSVARITVFANLTTAVSVFAGVVFLHEPFSWLGVVLCALILLGIYGVQLTAPKEQ